MMIESVMFSKEMMGVENVGKNGQSKMYIAKGWGSWLKGKKNLV